MRADIAARIALAGLLLTTVGCTERTVTSTSPVVVAPSPTPAPPDPLPAPLPAPTPAPSPPVLPLTIFSITFDRWSLFAGESTTGTVLFSRPAPAPVVVTLTSGDPGAVVVPQTVTIAQDRDRITFPVTTFRSLADDREISIIGSMNDSSKSGPLQLWIMPRAQTFFTFISDPGEYIGGGSFLRLTSPETTFVADKIFGGVAVRPLTGDYWYLRFQAPRGSELAIRRYDDVIWDGDQTHAAMSISGRARGCSAIGWFEVRELNIGSNGEVSRFDATFEQRCSGTMPSLRGEVRFVR